tara:strand:+ start:2472 stop:3089 length:618 start_codon:yes stop_codon:yes gene_type:complete
MRQIITLLFFSSSFFGFAQFYVADNGVLTLASSETILATQETVNTINSSIHGHGVFYLNSTQSQKLNSTSDFLHLPNLRLMNADLVDISTRVEVHLSLVIVAGTLKLNEDLYLQDANALQLLGNGVVLPSATGKLKCKSLITSNHSSLAVCVSNILRISITTTLHTIEVSECNRTIPFSHFESCVFCYKTPYLNLNFPPPKYVFS